MRAILAEEIQLLRKLAPMKGVIYVRGEECDIAIKLANTDLIATGTCDNTLMGAAIAVQITDEGRLFLDKIVEI